MVQVSNLCKSFAHQDILTNISFTIHKGEKVGLIGRNGHGKTTLLRMLAGTESPDSGTILFPKNYKISYLKQEMNFTHNTVLEEVLSSLPEDELQEIWKAEKILFGLDFTKEMVQQHPSVLSGGWMNRINLAKVLISNADMLLLDEPTNHLDIVTIHWLINFLKNWRKEIILITHDRFFMDAVCTHTMAIHRKQIRKIQGNSDKLYEQIAQDEEIYEKTRQNDAKERERIEKFISKFRAKARLGGLVQSRVKTLAKKDSKDRLEHIQNIDFAFTFKPFEPRNMISVRNVSFGYTPTQILIDDLSMDISKGDRIAIIGKNGKGKSTLLQLLAQKLHPLHGEIKFHPQLIPGYYGQLSAQHLNDNSTIEEEIASVIPQHNRNLARSIAGAMLFEGPLALKKCEVLSGGEKARVLLGKLIASPCHCLFLDEPSNHLDMQSVDSLIEALDIFEGTVIFVSHNEMILHSIATKLIVFDNNSLFIYEGSYQEFIADKGFSDEIPLDISKTPQKNSQKENRKERSKKLQEKNTLLKPYREKITQLENIINTHEMNITIIQQNLVDAASNNNGNTIAELSIELSQLKNNLEIYYEELFELQEQMEQLEQKFKN